MLIEFLLVLTLDGRHVEISTDQIVTLSEPRDEGEDKLMTDKIHCVITLTNGSKVSIAEECANVKRRLEGK